MENLQFFFRWLHVIAGITWIGHLYFFNFVNVPLQAALDDATKPNVNPKLMPRALWWFRWGAMVTWITGLIYLLKFMGATGATSESWPWWMVFVVWIVTVTVIWLLCRTVIDKLADAKSSPDAKAADKGMLVGIIEAILIVAMIAVFYCTFGNHVNGHIFFISIGGGMGTIMFMNVWMIIWPKSRKIIAAREQFLKDGTAVPPEMAKLGRRSFLASRTNTWFSIFMLIFMVLAGHGYGLWTMAN